MTQTDLMPIVDLPISVLSQESIERTRPHLDPERVRYYAEHLDEAMPVVVFDIDGDLLLADGYHRLAAAQQLGRTTLKADVRKGQRRDALQLAIDVAQQQRPLTKQQILDAIARRGRSVSEG